MSGTKVAHPHAPSRGRAGAHRPSAHHGPAPVSYTHLDVYKRQNLHRAQIEEALSKDVYYKYESLMRYSFRKGKFGAYFLMRSEINELLDVYKRQGPDGAGASGILLSSGLAFTFSSAIG